MKSQLALPDQLYMEIPSYGMTGTLEGASNEQMQTLEVLIRNVGLDFTERFYWHFGDAIGADAQCFGYIITRFPFSVITVAHPGLNITNARAFCRANEIREPIKDVTRDERIVYCAHNGVFGLPRTFNEILRSGTWTTIRRTGKLGRPCWLIKPDGEFDHYPQGYNTVLRRDMIDKDDEGYF